MALTTEQKQQLAGVVKQKFLAGEYQSYLSLIDTYKLLFSQTAFSHSELIGFRPFQVVEDLILETLRLSYERREVEGKNEDWPAGLLATAYMALSQDARKQRIFENEEDLLELARIVVAVLREIAQSGNSENSQDQDE